MRLYRRQVRGTKQSTYTADFSVGGKRHRLNTGHRSYSEAKEEAERLMRELVVATPMAAPPQGGRARCTVEEAVARWEASEALLRTSGNAQDLRLVKQLAGWFGPQKQLEHLNEVALQRWLTEERRGLHPNTQRRNLSKISAWLEWCIDHGLLPRDTINPVRRVKKPKRVRTKKTGLSSAEVDLVLESVKGHPQLEGAFMLALFAAMDQGEIARSRWEDVDWARNEIYVRGTKADPREDTIPLHTCLHAWLSERKRASGPIIAKSRENLRQGESSHYSPGALTKIRLTWNKMHPTAFQLPGFHEGRHTLATHLLRAGVSMYDVSKYLRHGSIRTTEMNYCHVVATDNPDGIQRFRSHPVPEPNSLGESQA